MEKLQEKMKAVPGFNPKNLLNYNAWCLGLNDGEMALFEEWQDPKIIGIGFGQIFRGVACAISKANIQNRELLKQKFNFGAPDGARCFYSLLAKSFIIFY